MNYIKTISLAKFLCVLKEHELLILIKNILECVFLTISNVNTVVVLGGREYVATLVVAGPPGPHLIQTPQYFFFVFRLVYKVVTQIVMYQIYYAWHLRVLRHCIY